MYRKICVPLMQVNSNIYAFVSGILVSLSTNIFTSLCFEPPNLSSQWHHYIATLFFVVSGAFCMYISFKVVDFQNYIASKKITDVKKKREIIEDATESKKTKWVLCFLLFILFLIAGFVMLGLNLVVRFGANNGSLKAPAHETEIVVR